MSLGASEKVTVLLVNDDAVVRRGLRRILEDDQDISIVGETGDGNSAVRIALQLQPRVILLDCALRGVDGFTAAREIAKCCPGIAIILSGVHSSRGWKPPSMDVDARRFVTGDATGADLVPLIKGMAPGERILTSLARHAESSGRQVTKLSTRELQVLKMIVAGNSTKEIAFQLGLSVNTVSVHRTRIARSLGVRSIAELIAYAVRTGLAKLPSEGD